MSAETNPETLAVVIFLIYVVVAVLLVAISSLMNGYWGQSEEAFTPMFWCSVLWPVVILSAVMAAPFWGLNKLGKLLRPKDPRP